MSSTLLRSSFRLIARPHTQLVQTPVHVIPVAAQRLLQSHTPSGIRSMSSFEALRSNPQAKAIMEAIMKDPELLTATSKLATLLQSQGLLDPTNPAKQPSKWDMVKMFANKEIRESLMDVATKLKKAGVLDSDLSAAAGATEAGGKPASPAEFLFSMFGAAGGAPPPPGLGGKEGQTLEIPEEMKKKLGRK
ncbi:hypothetical protein HDU67_002499 [Dinochytrium kinnereticum]|nr:hypothetical protein HDU67_002499 [Dinochytrium kinnereticum]